MVEEVKIMNNPFQVHKLPLVAMSEVYNNMPLSERIKLALTSKKMNWKLTFSKFKLSLCYVHIRDDASNVYLYDEKITILCGRVNLEDGEILTRRDVSLWIDKKKSTLENTVNVFTKLQEISRCTSFGLALDFANMKKIYARTVLMIPELQRWKKIFVQGQQPTKRNMNRIMELANPERDIVVETKFPNDYHHKKAFNFMSMVYEDATWVRIENLFSLKNNCKVYLGTNTLTSANFNTFLKYWVNSDCDMFRKMTVITTEKFKSSQSGFFDDIVVMKTYRNLCDFYLISADAGKHDRKQKLLSIIEIHNGFQLITYSTDELVECCRTIHHSFTVEYKILKILNLLNEVKKESQDLAENINEEINIRKADINYKIKKISDEINNMGVQFINNVATLLQSS